jgi:hypothetical protein
MEAGVVEEEVAVGKAASPVLHELGIDAGDGSCWNRGSFLSVNPSNMWAWRHGFQRDGWSPSTETGQGPRQGNHCLPLPSQAEVACMIPKPALNHIAMSQRWAGCCITSDRRSGWGVASHHFSRYGREIWVKYVRIF